MNKRQKPSKSRRGAGITLAVCFVAAAVMVGTYTLRNYQEAKRQEQALAEENADTKEKESQEEAGSSLVINTEEDPADGAAAEETRDSGTQDAAGETAGYVLLPDLRECRKCGFQWREHTSVAGGWKFDHELQHGQDCLLFHPGPVQV